ncbi:TonB-dependent receptor domain-containing protein [Alteromonas sp. W364]|uniref:TonB-dependent receptor plug domain-containing protein n=1 Tax=Alteromonas sp. W364 TaxID=3075610 RepID=UPI0028883633|nr:TonB-dependent receptor [Alteromonas sp. W364]MDT0627124.1 TonB-dependent receptor [Alteromonas sp. W364]
MFSLSRIASLVILFTCASEAIAGQKLVMASNAKEPALRSGSMLSENNDLQQEDDDDDEDVEKIIVQATRSGRIADELPMRVEIINREEIMEKSTMRPGNISMLVAETGGVRVQTTSPALGSANIRLQGLYGRYTQLLADGLPLYGNQAASIGILQIPPTDLGRVEIIKGSASSLYGGSALGGVINLVSRRPGEEFNGETIVNLTTRDAQDVTTYIESPLSTSLKGSLTAGAHHQKSVDIDNDDWIDLAGYERYTVRPRLFWNGDEGESLYFTAGYMTENRRGGTVDGGVVADGDAFEQTQDSKRFDSGLVFTMPLGDNYTFSTRASAMIQEHNHLFGDVIEDDKHDSYLLESSLSGYTDRSDWVVGLAYLSDIYESDTFPTFDYSYEVPSLFAQVDYEMTSELTTSVSARVDEHSDFGTQVSPRVSLLYRPGDLTIRGSYGKGYYAPTPFVEEIEAAGLSRLAPIQGLVEEQAETASLDFTYTYNNIETSFTLFGSNVENVTELEALSSEENMMLDRVRLVNADGESQIRGSEVLVRYYWHDIKLTASYLYLDATEQATADGDRQKISLTPQHSAGFVAMWEEEDEFRVGFEAYYTGPQRVNDNPFIDESDPYWHLGLMGEITVGRASYFINLENLLDIKQTDEHPLLLPARAPSGQWTTDIWSRNDGFIANAGVRVSF